METRSLRGPKLHLCSPQLSGVRARSPAPAASPPAPAAPSLPPPQWACRSQLRASTWPHRWACGPCFRVTKPSGWNPSALRGSERTREETGIARVGTSRLCPRHGDENFQQGQFPRGDRTLSHVLSDPDPQPEDAFQRDVGLQTPD